MKVRVEILPDAPEEIVIRVPRLCDEVQRVQALLEKNPYDQALCLFRGGTEYFVPLSEIIFFETEGNAVKVHTRDRIFSTDEKLYRLEQLLPRAFARVSKSCILNSAAVSALTQGVTGTAEAQFSGTAKRAYISRMYCKSLKSLIYETRVLK